MMDPMKADLSLAMLAHVQKTGQAIEMVNDISNNDVFENLSKHNPFWDSSDEIQEIRTKLLYIEDKIITLRELLTIDPYEGSL